MAKKMGEQIDQIAAKIANKKDIKWKDNLNTVLDSKGGFSEPTKEYLQIANQLERRDIMIKDLDEQITELKKKNLSLKKEVNDLKNKNNMTPKEKAEDLWLKYYEIVDDIYSNEAAKKNAKMYALIAVNETIRTLNEDIRDVDVRGNILLDLIDYWREVKQEIEKL